jgi:hypothetical protein
MGSWSWSDKILCTMEILRDGNGRLKSKKSDKKTGRATYMLNYDVI